MVILHGNLHPMTGENYPDGFVRFSDTVIACGPMAAYEPVAGEEVYDAGGSWVLPGLVDAHTHLGLFEDGLAFEGDDGNESTDPVTPQLRALDGINPQDRCFAEALAAGVTTAVVAPGSANPIGGQVTAIKTYGRRVDDMVIREPLAMKFALGENPKRVYNDRDETPMTRMGTAALIREALQKAKDYRWKVNKAAEDVDIDPPDYDMKCESLLPVLRREIQAHFHAHRADDIFTAIRIAKEFGLDYVIIHGTEGHLVADLLAEERTRVVTGPTLLERCKPELRNQTTAGVVELQKSGVLCAICTDHPETGLKYLPLCAAAAVRDGMDPGEALACITRKPAQIVGLGDRVGTLAPGLDADILVLDGSPLELQSKVQAVFGMGKRLV